MWTYTGRKWSRGQLKDGKETLHQCMFFALSNGVPIEREGDIIGGYGHGGKEAKCILVVVVLGITLSDGIECLGNLCRCG
jgi:hypothetical protein